jgi:hypothetical protein
MAQLVAHHTGSVGVRGSNPLSSTQKPQVRAFSQVYRSYASSVAAVVISPPLA